MEYFVDFKIHNSENDGWAFKTELHTSDYKVAKKKFFAVCEQYENTTFDKGIITLTDEKGFCYKKEDLAETIES